MVQMSHTRRLEASNCMPLNQMNAMKIDLHLRADKRVNFYGSPRERNHTSMRCRAFKLPPQGSGEENFVLAYWASRVLGISFAFCDEMRFGPISPMLDLYTTATPVIYSSASSKAFQTRTTTPAVSRTNWRLVSLRTSRVHLSNRSR